MICFIAFTQDTEVFTNEGNTAFVFINLAAIPITKNVEATDFETELSFLIANYMGISPAAIQVIEVIPYVEGQVTICTGNIADFLNGVTQQDEFFIGTMLEGASIKDVIWQFPCTEAYSFSHPTTFPSDGTDGYTTLLQDLGLESSDFSSDYTLSDILDARDASGASRLIGISFILLWSILFIIF